MPKKRRKLSPEMEAEIATARRDVELITAKINDIDDEDIQLEYRKAFDGSKNAYINLTILYKQVGFSDESQAMLHAYKTLVNSFTNEYEI